jgi:flagellar basal-body rod modification protein FlgD
MSNVSNDKSALDGMYWGEKPTTPENNNNGALTQSDFFALLTQQLAYQDPTKPVENDQMIAQMTQFTMADGISQMSSNFKDFATSMNSSQALQASTLVGQHVLVKSKDIVFDGENAIVASANFPDDATDVKIKIKNSDGVVVRSVTLKEADAGRLQLPWDGTTDTQAVNTDGTPKTDGDGKPVMEVAKKGIYRIEVEATIDKKNEAIVTSIYAPVTSVTLGNGTTQGLLLNVYGQGQKKLSEIEEITI